MDKKTTNEEKAKKLAIQLIGDDRNVQPLIETLVTMAEWKEQQMIEKAVEWLERNFNTPNDFKEHFKKAMEE